MIDYNALCDKELTLRIITKTSHIVLSINIRFTGLLDIVVCQTDRSIQEFSCRPIMWHYMDHSRLASWGRHKNAKGAP